MLKMVFGFLVLMMLACTSGTKEESQPAVATQVNEYPDLLLTFEDGDTLRTRQLEGNNLLIFFQPDCHHCQEEAINIEQRLDSFKNYKLYFISSSTMESIKAFEESLDLDNHQNVQFAWTSTESVLAHFGPIQTPSVYIYSNGKLRKSFNGQTDIENILKAL